MTSAALHPSWAKLAETVDVMRKQAFDINAYLPTDPAARQALLGGAVGAGGLGLAALIGSKKNKLRNALLAGLVGGAGGAGIGYGMYNHQHPPVAPSQKVEAGRALQGAAPSAAAGMAAASGMGMGPVAPLAALNAPLLQRLIEAQGRNLRITGANETVAANPPGTITVPSATPGTPPQRVDVSAAGHPPRVLLPGLAGAGIGAATLGGGTLALGAGTAAARAGLEHFNSATARTPFSARMGSAFGRSRALPIAGGMALLGGVLGNRLGQYSSYNSHLSAVQREANTAARNFNDMAGLTPGS